MGGEGEHIMLLLWYTPSPSPYFNICSSIITKSKDKGVHMSKAKHVAQSKQNHVSGTYNLSQSINYKVLYQPVFQWSV